MPPTLAAQERAIDTTRAALRRLAEERDPQAWSLIVERHGQRMFQSAARITGDKALAEDACQEAFLHIRDKAGQFQPRGNDHEAAAVAWILRIAATCALQLMRSKRRRTHHEQAAGHERPEGGDSESRDALEQALRAELAELPESHRLPLALHYFSGLDYNSIASQVGCSVGSARVRVHRALERLRSRLVRAGVAVTAGALATKLSASESAAILPSAQLSAQWAALLDSGAVGSGVGLSIAAKASLTVAGIVAAGALSVAAGHGFQPEKGLQAATAEPAGEPLPAGIASRYPGDENIASDPHVLFTENFESGRIEDIIMRWGWGGPQQGAKMVLGADHPAASRGARSLDITLAEFAVDKEKGGFGGHLYTHTRGVDRMHLRFYVKLHERHGYSPSFFNIVAERASTRWPNGEEDKRPDGSSRFSSMIELFEGTSPPGSLGFYSYWHDMQPDGGGHYWGNPFVSESEPIPRGRWVCIEAMVQANSHPDATDGEQALWVDGRPKAYFKGIRWRTDDMLTINSVWLLYGAQAEAQTAENEAWFDDIVVADQYIGPIKNR